MTLGPHPRICAIAARCGKRVVCPPGGCVLARMLEPERAGPATPCLAEQIADRSADNALVLLSLDALREDLEEAYGHRPALTHPRGRPAGGSIAA